MIKIARFDVSDHLDSEEMIAAYIREVMSSGDGPLINAALSDIEKIAPSSPIKTKAEYDRAVMVLNGILDVGGADENHRLATLVASLGGFISQYERAHGL